MGLTKPARLTDFAAAQAELVRRSLPGAMSYFGLLLVVGLFSPYRLDHPKVFYVSIAVFLCIGVIRLVLTKLLQRRGALTPRWAQTAFRWGVLTNAFVWGIFSAVTLKYYGQEWTGMIVLLMRAGIAAVGHSALNPALVLL